MTSHSESDASTHKRDAGTKDSQWLKVGLVATASALAGGLAAAWWYRKTLKTLRQSGEITQNPHFGIQKDTPADEL
jgi:hypothetical protein